MYGLKGVRKEKQKQVLAMEEKEKGKRDADLGFRKIQSLDVQNRKYITDLRKTK